MALKDTKDLNTFLKPFSREKVKVVLWLREWVWKQYPKCNELIYDSYQAVALGWSPTTALGQTFCNIAIGGSSENIHFGFYRGKEISDPEKMLTGKGNQYRYIVVNSLMKVRDDNQPVQGKTITKAIAVKKRAPKKAVNPKK